MSLLTASNLAKFYGPDEVFSGITIEIPHRARIALVGPNGAGKTTLLNLLAGLDLPTEGTVTTARGTRIGFLPQRPELAGDHSLWDEQLRGVADLRRMEAELEQVSHDLADPDRHDAALERYGRLQEHFELAGGYTYESRIRMVLQGVGFDEADFSLPLPKLSGGQRTRALLARLLLEAPDLLVLDEPTNHLDIDAVEWLENFLSEFPGAVLAVSHDRYFMDAFAATIWELDYGALETYRGNYSHYLTQRQERYERLLKEYEQQQEFIAKEQDYIRKHMGSRWTAQAKGRQKKLETMNRRGRIIARPRGPRQEMKLRIAASMRSGDKVIMTKALSVGYPDADAPLFSVPDITLYRGETAALIGPNGVGKSTFLKTIIAQLPPLAGEVTVGASVKVGYFAQAHELLNPGSNLIDEITRVKPMPISEARNFLGLFLFSGDEVFRTVDTLSGGERGRLALAKLALDGANLLLLDEPTNHLDIDSQEVLQEVLSGFGGTILLVSHDRYLIDALASQVWAAQPGTLQIFKGTYQEYLADKRKQTELIAPVPANGKSTNGKAPQTKSTEKRVDPRKIRQQIDAAEQHVHAIEARLESLTAAIEDASASGETQRLADLAADYAQAEADLLAAMEAWEALVSQ
jgi:ATP-binding cassette subfamily F protein 3